MASEAIATSSTLEYEKLMTRFDALVAKGIVVYKPPTITRLEDKNLKVSCSMLGLLDYFLGTKLRA